MQSILKMNALQLAAGCAAATSLSMFKESYDKARIHLVSKEGNRDMRGKLTMTAIPDKMRETNLPLE